MQHKNLQSSDHFNSLYLAASNLDEARLRDLLNQNVMLDEKAEDGMLTVTALLAMEKKYDAVLLLLKYGADPSYAAYGAACIDDIAFAESLRKKYGACVYELAKGVNNTKYAAELLDRYPGVLPSLAFASMKSPAPSFDRKQLIEIVNITQFNKLSQNKKIKPLLSAQIDFYSAQLAAMLMNKAPTRNALLNEIQHANDRPSLAGIFQKGAKQLRDNKRKPDDAQILDKQALRLAL